MDKGIKQKDGIEEGRMVGQGRNVSNTYKKKEGKNEVFGRLKISQGEEGM